MLIRRPRAWNLPDRDATPEELVLSRRALLGGALAAATLPVTGALAQEADPNADLYPARRVESFTLDRPVTAEAEATSYNNFFEFGSSKRVAAAAQALKIRPWTLTLDGLVEKPQQLDVDALIRRIGLEERLYRLRCVEAWAMAVPWSGFPLKALVDLAAPLSNARYLRFETFLDPKVAAGQRQSWYPWPYTEGLTMAEARHDLAFIATGVYGKPLPKQMGAPIRLAVPWKYGFKSIKSITRISFVAERPKSYWEALQPSEYGFWANVNPEVSHPRWSQASERMIGSNERRPTLLFNGYGEFVADLYKDLGAEKLFT